MTRAHSIWMLLLGVALLSPISASRAFTVCGGVDGTSPRVPCDCGDTVGITPTILSATDPVTRKVCTAADGVAALLVGRLVNLNMKAATLRCDTSGGFIAGVRIGDGVTVDGGGGIIEGCDIGIFGSASNSLIIGVTARNGGDGFSLSGNHNQLVRNLCNDNFFKGIFVRGNANILDRNYCKGNAGDGIAVLGNANQLHHNQGRSNGGHGVVASPFGGANQSDSRNYGTGNTLSPQCEIDGHSTTSSGKYC